MTTLHYLLHGLSETPVLLNGMTRIICTMQHVQLASVVVVQKQDLVSCGRAG